MSHKEKTVTIVSLTYYDARHYIDEAVLSIENLDYPKDKLTWVIVDNTSHGPSAKYIRENVIQKSGKSLPRIEFIENDTNRGFAEGNNQGIQHAISHETDYVFLLNNDAKFEKNAIREAVMVAESDKTIGAVQSLILLWKEPEIINTSGNDVHFLGFGMTRDYKLPLAQLKRGDGEEIAAASGAAVLYRTQALRDVGGLDDFLWLYHEDLELSWRLRLAGWKSVLARNSIVYHDYSFSRSTEKMFWMERNRWIVHLTHLKLSTLLLISPALLIMELLILGGSVKGGWILDKLKSYGSLLRPSTIKNILSKRCLSQNFRVVSDGEAMRLFVGRIEHQEVEDWVLTRIVNPVTDLYWKIIKIML